MSRTPHRRQITEADLAATARLRALWDDRAKALGVTQDRIAELLNGTQGLVSQYLNGKLALNYRAVLAFSTALGVEPSAIRDDLPEQDLASRVAEPSPTYGAWSDVRSYNQAAALGDGVEVDEYAEAHKLKFRSESLRRQGLDPSSLAVFYGKGDSMLPRIRSGDAILFDTANTRPDDEALFVIQCIGVNKSEICVKRCRVFGDDIYFESLNPTADHSWRKPRRMDDTKHPITVLGRVRWIGSWEP